MENSVPQNIQQVNSNNTSIPIENKPPGVYPQTSLPADKIHSKKLLAILLLASVLVVIIFVFFFKYLSEKKGKDLVATSPTLVPSATITPLTQQGEILQSLERNPTQSVLIEEVYVSLSGITEAGYTGAIQEGVGLTPREEDKKEQEKRQQQIKNDPKANNSLFLIGARDKNNRVLIEQPLAVVDTSIKDDVVHYTYQNPGYFSVYLLLPIDTNSIVLRTRVGQILDRVYVEDWEPEVKILNYPRTVGSTDKFQVSVELLPEGKAYSYSLFLKNVKDGSNMGMIGGSLQPKSGKIIENVDLSQYPFTATDSWVIEAVGYSLFHSKTVTSEPISINLSSENIEVEISGKEKATRRSGESDYISWSHTFYGVDVTRGLKELCEKGRCFELIWSGENVQFNEKYWELNPVDTVTTQITSLQCNFRGSGKQSIHLQVKENGKVIGEDTYTYTVSGIGNEQSICQISDY